jgi:hypothetical protein
MRDVPLEPIVTVRPPIYLVLSQHGCWKCHKITPVATFAAKRIDEQIPDELRDEDDEDEGVLLC